jgi:hypothetical protein
MISFLSRERKSLDVIHKYLSYHHSDCQLIEKRFYAFLRMKKERVGNYITMSILREFLEVEPQQSFYPVEEQRFYLKLIRVVFMYYINSVSPVCSLTSTRIQKDYKIEHIRVQRQIIRFLRTG